MIPSKSAVLLLSCLSLSSALPLSVAEFYGSFQQVLESVSHKFSPSSDHLSTSGGANIVSLIPEQEYESWINAETDVAFEGIIQNIGGYGSVEGVMAGTVVASPSKQSPDYFYQWIRDAGITINNLVLSFADQKAQNLTLKAIISDYIESSKIIQRVSNPSGDFASLEGLGEPKFQVNGSPFNENWGRPQRDGPALRSIAIINYINAQVKYNQSASYEDFRTIFNDIIRPDLDYVGLNWRLDGFDLWEEVKGLHFFTSMSHRRSLLIGSKLAKNLGYESESDFYESQAHHMSSFIKDHYYDEQKGHLIETAGRTSRSGLDSALFLGSIHSLDLIDWEGEADKDTMYPPYSDEVVSSLVQYLGDMRYRYPINSNRLRMFENYGINSSLVGIAVGRYPEDIYNGVGTSVGNPWFLCTATVSQTLYVLADYLHTRPDSFNLTITDRTRPLYGLFMESTEGFDWAEPTFVLRRTDPSYNAIVRSIVSYGDSFLDVIREHHDDVGSMSEQFSRYDGYMKGAEKLTWSFGAFWSAVRQRNLVYNRLGLKN